MYWNNHKLRTEHSQISNQLWISGIHQIIEHETVHQIIDASSTKMSPYGVEMYPNVRFIEEQPKNIIIPRTLFEPTNEGWVTINAMELTSNDGNFGINMYLNLCANLEGLQYVREYLQG